MGKFIEELKKSSGFKVESSALKRRYEGDPWKPKIEPGMLSFKLITEESPVAQLVTCLTAGRERWRS